MRCFKTQRFPFVIKGIFAFSMILSFALGCGIEVGTGGTNFGDAAPTGTIVAQGQFQESANVTGTALIYLSNGAYILRLQTMVYTDISTGMQISTTYTSNGGTGEIAPVRTRLPNQNYTLSISTSAAPTFANIRVISSQNPNVVYGTALLSAP